MLIRSAQRIDLLIRSVDQGQNRLLEVLVGQNRYQRNNCEEILKINLDFVCERERERDLERERERTDRERERKQTDT
jgi:hypothetical protein